MLAGAEAEAVKHVLYSQVDSSHMHHDQSAQPQISQPSSLILYISLSSNTQWAFLLRIIPLVLIVASTEMGRFALTSAYGAYLLYVVFMLRV
jgi:hypothetical protein